MVKFAGGGEVHLGFWCLKSLGLVKFVSSLGVVKFTPINKNSLECLKSLFVENFSEGGEMNFGGFLKSIWMVEIINWGSLNFVGVV